MIDGLRRESRAEREALAEAWAEESGYEVKLENIIIITLNKTTTVFRLAMAAGGYDRHKRQWRPMGKTRKEQQQPPTREQVLAEHARRLFAADKDGTLARAYGGDSARVAADALIDSYTDDPY
jgi:hypothetical protein